MNGASSDRTATAAWKSASRPFLGPTGANACIALTELNAINTNLIIVKELATEMVGQLVWKNPMLYPTSQRLNRYINPSCAAVTGSWWEGTGE